MSGPNYADWNSALIDYLTAGVRRGSPVYLAIDDRSLAAVWRHLLRRGEATTYEVRRYFTECVRGHALSGGWSVRPDRLLGLDVGSGTSHPRGVAFLAAMVLAAYDMGDDEAAAENNYYYRYYRVFESSSTRRGRPEWLTHQGEPLDELVWQAWNNWLLFMDWEPTACPGDANTRFVHYPISQSILREGDRLRLRTLFRAKFEEHQRSWDRDLLGAYLPEIALDSSSVRLRKLLSGTDCDPRRFDAVVDAAFSVYSSMDWSDAASESDSIRAIELGLYRMENRRGEVTFLPYPRIPQHWHEAAELSVEITAGQVETLKPDPSHAGRYQPLKTPLPRLSDIRIPLISDGTEHLSLVLPQRDFWILVHEPDDEASPALATWGLPALGESFLLLTRPAHDPQLQSLKDLELLAWQGKPRAIKVGGVDWKEYHGCQVLRPRWDHVVPRRESRMLVESLRPRPSRLTITFEGGLCVPGRTAWLRGFLPQIRVRATAGSFTWTVRDYLTKAPIRNAQEGLTHQPTVLRELDLPVGDYQIDISADEVSGGKILRIVSWEDLTPTEPVHRRHPVRGDRFELWGAHLQPTQTENQ